MRLLMITRRIDRDDPTTSFTVRWVETFAAQVDQLHVMCLERGNTEGLPDNVRIYSLGKEHGKNRLREFLRFQRYAITLVPKVDGIFSHQNPEYGMLIGPYARVYRKPLFAWYVHSAVTWKLRLLNVFATKMISINRASFRLPNDAKAVYLHHGIDTDRFRLCQRSFFQDDRIRLISVARISRSKNIDTMIRVVKELNRQGGRVYELTILGTANTPEQQMYLKELEALVEKHSLHNTVHFLGGLPNDQIMNQYARADILLNFSDTGSVDKAVLEAMSTGTLVATTNEAFAEIFAEHEFAGYGQTGQEQALIESLVSLSNPQGLTQRMHDYVVAEHSLTHLISTITQLYE